MKTFRWEAWVAALAMLTISGTPAAHEAEGAVCDKNAKMPAVAAAKDTLDKNPAVLESWFSLADAWSGQGCFADAVHVLEDGAEANPRNQELQTRLRYARSLVSEQNYFDGLDKAEKAAEVRRNLFRCTKLSDLKACDDGLAANPNDAELLLAKGDALAAAKRPVEALAIYRRAEMNGAGDGIRDKIQAAEAKRQDLVQRCEEGSGAGALGACQQSLSSGAPDEFVIQKRIGVLLQASDRAPQALDSYIAAGQIDPSDQAVALAIVALTDSTGRKDALALASRGTALLTLGRADEALAVLKKAQSLDAGLPDIKVRVAQAETARSGQLKQGRPVRLALADSTQTATDVGAGSNTRVKKPVRPVQLTVTQPQRTYSNAAEAGRSH